MHVCLLFGRPEVERAIAGFVRRFRRCVGHRRSRVRFPLHACMHACLFACVYYFGDVAFQFGSVSPVVVSVP